jgi:hypothetical protein
MKRNRTPEFVRYLFVPSLLLLIGCGRAPSFDILGSFFPAWLLCLVIAILLTVFSRELLRRYVEIAWPIVVYPSLTAAFTFALWLMLFQ